MYVWTLPLQILISVTFLLYVVGWPALAGIFVMVLMIPVGGAMGQAVAKKQKALMASTDKRIHSTHELLNGIRLVKFYAWETNFLSKIDAARDLELSNLWSYIRTIAFNRALWVRQNLLYLLLD